MIKEFEQMKGGLEKIDIAQMKVSDDQVYFFNIIVLVMYLVCC